MCVCPYSLDALLHFRAPQRDCMLQFARMIRQEQGFPAGMMQPQRRTLKNG
jgi:hypothetical protein